MSAMSRTRRAVLNGALLFFGSSIALRAMIELLYFDAPRQPDPSSGRVVLHVIKTNVAIYITQNLSDLLFLLKGCFYVGGAAIVICIILNEIWPPDLSRPQR